MTEQDKRKSNDVMSCGGSDGGEGIFNGYRGGGGSRMPTYPTSRGGMASGQAPKITIERTMGSRTFRFSEGNTVHGNLTIEQIIAHLRAWV